MKKITLHNYVLLLLVIVFASCNNEENVMPKTEAENSNFEKIVIEEGIVAFESMDDFSEFLKNANTKDEFLVEFEKQFSEFKSNFDAYEAINESQVEEMLSNPEKYSAFAKIVEDNGEKYLEPIVDDVNIRSVVNESGIVKIGKKYYKFTYERVFISEKLSDLENNTTGRLSNVETIEVIRGSGESLRMPNEDCRQDYTKRVKISNWPRIYRNINCRFRGRLWTVNIGSIYSGIGANSTHYVKTAGVWFRDKAPMLRLEYDVDYIQYFPTAGNIYLTDSFDSGEKSNVRRIDETFQFCVNASCNFSFDSADSYHSGRGDAGNSWGCNLNI
ncbi:hypothetical protein SAMN05661096_02309 [Marivirga sericea]|uniref:DUF4848 domain-containing protein n=1 Tax=Marivirga sericea TaxID=1028 RepID=A0A1X7K3J4_9BACT|nr:hypothetical protein [Marivirga sericea]SMG35172.1 hypothetical protein SAMN05661096_02309 [Marivirga sericea]